MLLISVFGSNFERSSDGKNFAFTVSNISIPSCSPIVFRERNCLRVPILSISSIKMTQGDTCRARLNKFCIERAPLPRSL